jgi:hypothetical protein
LRVAELKNALCNQDKLLCRVLRQNKRLNLELENSFAEIASLRSMHDDMSAKPCENCKIIMVNYVDLWIVHTQIATQLKGAKLELRELKAYSLLLGACTSCPMLRSNLEDCAVEIKKLKHQIDYSSHYSVLSPLCKMCSSLKGKLFRATKENAKLTQEVAYLTSHLERTLVSEKMIEDDLNRVEESATKSTYKLGVGFERCEDKGEKSAPKFIPSSNYHKEEETIKSKAILQPQDRSKERNPQPREEACICMFCGCAGHLDEFCFYHKRIEKMCFDYARNSYRNEFTDFLPHTSSCASSHSFHGPNHHSYGFGS